jgi:hypothetical protein
MTSASIVTRSLLVSGSVAALGFLTAGPALASDSVYNQDPTGLMTPGTAVLIFAGIPLLVAALIWLLVSAPGWTRKGRTSDAAAFSGDALVVGSDAEMAVGGGDFGSSKPAMDIASGIDVPPGGTSARW